MGYKANMPASPFSLFLALCFLYPFSFLSSIHLFLLSPLKEIIIMCIFVAGCIFLKNMLKWIAFHSLYLRCQNQLILKLHLQTSLFKAAFVSYCMNYWLTGEFSMWKLEVLISKVHLTFQKWYWGRFTGIKTCPLSKRAVFLKMSGWEIFST